MSWMIGLGKAMAVAVAATAMSDWQIIKVL
jgi:hypothetical protein